MAVSLIDDPGSIGAMILENEGLPMKYIMDTVKCFLCDHIFFDGEETWFMFEKRISDGGELVCALSTILSSALGQELEETETHSTLLCNACNDVLLQFEQLEKSFCEVRYRILTAYNRTARSKNLSPIAIEINGVLQMDEEIKVDKRIEENVLIPPKIEPEDIIEEAPNMGPNSDLSFEVYSYVSSLVEEIDEDEFITGDNATKYPFSTISIEDCQAVKAEIDDRSLSEANDQFVEENDMSMSIIKLSPDEQDMIAYEQIINQSDESNYSDGDNMSLRSHTEITNEDSQSQSQNSDILYEMEGDEIQSTQNPQQTQAFVGHIYCCLICNDDVERDLKSYSDHMRVAHNSRVYICDLCRKGFVRRSDMNFHIDQEHSNTKHECDTCKRVFSSYRLFRRHKRMHYRSTKQFECTECHKRYSSKNMLDEHMNMHTGARPYKCSQCPKDFASKYTLQTHNKIHTERQRPYQCDICGKAFLSQQNLASHTKLHVDGKAFPCEICLKSFGTKHNLDVHMIVHSGQRPFICRTCGKSFARRAEIKDHERIHTGERPFKCDLCTAAFAQRSNLMSHKKSTHLNEKLHKCYVCERSFKRRRLLDYHIQAVHTGERPHKCEYCEAAFVYPEHYKKHMLIHSGHKPYACEVCGKQFNSRDNRNAHRFVHSEKKPYECLECGAGFMRKPLLLAHMRMTKHANDTIIVNQPQISASSAVHLLLNDETILADEESVDVAEVPAQLLVQMAEEDVNGNASEDVSEGPISSIDGELIKNEMVEDNYLQFEDLERDGGQELTWVDISEKD